MPNKFLLQLEGHIGKDPEFKETANGKPTCYFSVAVTKKGKEKADDKTAWFNINVYGYAVDQCRVLKKGDPVVIETEDPLSVRGFKRTGNDGEEYINISISTFKVLPINWTRREKTQNNNSPEPLPQSTPDEDLPF